MAKRIEKIRVEMVWPMNPKDISLTSWAQNRGNRWPGGWKKATIAKENPSFGPYRN